MLDTKILTENYIVIVNDSVFTFKNEITTIEFKYNNENILKINFIFAFDEKKEQKIEARPPNLTDLNVTIFNAVGEGATTEPLLIRRGENNTKKMYLSFFFKKMSESFLINYTIFEQK